MADPLPSARTVSRPTWRHWLIIAVLVLGTGLVLAAAWYFIPAKDGWVRWVYLSIPVVCWAAALADATLRGESRWTLVLDPARPPDARRGIYVGFDLAFTVGYLVALKHLIPNRHDDAMALLYLLPLATWLMASGTAIGRRWSWWLVVAGAVTLLVWTIAVFVVLLYTASYLSGVYGAFGKAASTGVLGAMAIVVQFVALLPTFQLKWAMTRAGRRAFGLRPLGRAPEVRGVALAPGKAAA